MRIEKFRKVFGIFRNFIQILYTGCTDVSSLNYLNSLPDRNANALPTAKPLFANDSSQQVSGGGGGGYW